MVRKLLGIALSLGLPAVLSAQAPATTDKPAVTHGKATRRLGEVVRAEPTEDTDRDRDDRAKQEDKDRDRDDPGRVGNPNAATPATPAIPAKGEGPAQRAKPATPSVPSPNRGHKP